MTERTERKPICDMIKMRDSDDRIRWRCSECGTLHRDTQRLRYSRCCEVCDRPIMEWVDDD